MKQKIIDFCKDEEDDWLAILGCGHTRHVRHRPPWFNRPWVEIEGERVKYLGTELDCKKCDDAD